MFFWASWDFRFRILGFEGTVVHSLAPTLHIIYKMVIPVGVGLMVIPRDLGTCEMHSGYSGR